MAASKIRIKKICEYCGQEFYALKTSTRFCSKSVSYTHLRAHET